MFKSTFCKVDCFRNHPTFGRNLSTYWKVRAHHKLLGMAPDALSVIPDGSNYLPNPMRTFQVVVAATRRMGIGKNGKLPWRLPSDVKFFKKLTMTTSDPARKNAVIMGRKTWESIPSEYRPLPGRLNVVLTSSKSSNIARTENIVICSSVDSALQVLAESPYCSWVERVFLIGGGQVLRDTLNGPGCDAIHLTDIEREFECDTFLQSIDFSLFWLWYSSSPSVENNIRYSFNTYVRVGSSTFSGIPLQDGTSLNKDDGDQLDAKGFSFLPKMIFERHEEYGYLKLVQDIMVNGVPDVTNGKETLSKFGCRMCFNLRKSFPLLTTKNLFWRGVVEELLWSISGATNAKVLQEKGIHIWDGYASRELPIIPVGLVERAEGDLGPIYGFQWRHSGAMYTDMCADYTGKGFDQLLDVIDKIKRNPKDCQIILSAWNPSDLKLMTVSPCHVLAQFYVANGELSCQMYQSTGDMELQVPRSIASYCLLTCIIAHLCDLQPGDFVHVLGDARVYKTSIKALGEQLQKQPRPFPVLRINPLKKDIDSFVADDFELVGYDPRH